MPWVIAYDHASWHMGTYIHMNESWHTWMSHGTHEWVMTHMKQSWHTWMSHGTHQSVMTHMNESWHTWMSHGTHEWVMTHMNESWHTWMSHDTHKRWVTSHTLRGIHGYREGCCNLRTVVVICIITTYITNNYSIHINRTHAYWGGCCNMRTIAVIWIITTHISDNDSTHSHIYWETHAYREVLMRTIELIWMRLLWGGYD